MQTVLVKDGVWWKEYLSSLSLGFAFKPDRLAFLTMWLGWIPAGLDPQVTHDIVSLCVGNEPGGGEAKESPRRTLHAL